MIPCNHFKAPLISNNSMIYFYSTNSYLLDICLHLCEICHGAKYENICYEARKIFSFAYLFHTLALRIHFSLTVPLIEVNISSISSDKLISTWFVWE